MRGSYSSLVPECYPQHRGDGSAFYHSTVLYHTVLYLSLSDGSFFVGIEMEFRRINHSSSTKVSKTVISDLGSEQSNIV